MRFSLLPLIPLFTLTLPIHALPTPDDPICLDGFCLNTGPPAPLCSAVSTTPPSNKLRRFDPTTCLYLNPLGRHTVVNGIPTPTFYLPQGTYVFNWAPWFVSGPAAAAIIYFELWQAGSNGSPDTLIDAIFTASESFISEGIVGMYIILRQQNNGGPHQLAIPWVSRSG
ncbi:hypothetical protein MMC12_004173 [Toensbergia leucococca]|nr:hypothetical protein [Toensbergia leucococca]